LSVGLSPGSTIPSAPASVADRFGCWKGAHARRRLAPGRARRRSSRSLFLQLPLKDLDLLGQRHVVADKAFDLAHGMQNRGVIATAKAPADFRQRTQG